MPNGRHPRWTMRACMGLILLLAWGLRLFRLDHQSLWWDEMHTAVMSVVPIDAMWDNLFEIRNHVPLYFLLMRLWATMGNSAFVLRFFSLLCGVAGVVLIYVQGRRMGGWRTGIVAALLLAVSPMHIWYSQEARMYALLSACALGANGFLLRLLRRPGNAPEGWRAERWDWLGYGLCMLAAVYTHYLAAFVLLAHYVFFAVRYRMVRTIFGRWLLCSAVVGALFVAWVAAIMASGGFVRSPIGWIAPAHWYEPALTLLVFAAGNTIDPSVPWVRGPSGLASWGYLALVACLAAIAVAWWHTRRQRLRHRRPGHAALAQELLWAWLAVPLLLLWLISLDLPIAQKRSIYVDRYLIASLPAFLLLVARGVALLSRRKKGLAALLAPAFLALIVAVSALALRNAYFDPQYARDDWRGAMAYLRSAWQAGDVLLLRPNHTLPLGYYAGGSLAYHEIPFLFAREEQDEFLARQLASTLADLGQRWERAWLISAVENTNAHGFPYQRNAALAQIGEQEGIKAWMDAHRQRLVEVCFPGICLTRYALD